MQYILDHTTVAFGLIDIVSIVIFVAAAVIVSRKLRKMKERQENLEKKHCEKYAKEYEDGI